MRRVKLHGKALSIVTMLQERQQQQTLVMMVAPKLNEPDWMYVRAFARARVCVCVCALTLPFWRRSHPVPRWVSDAPLHHGWSPGAPGSCGPLRLPPRERTDPGLRRSMKVRTVPLQQRCFWMYHFNSCCLVFIKELPNFVVVPNSLTYLDAF